MDSSFDQLRTSTLQPRYRRLLTFGDVLDESMLLFRKHWLTFALVSAIALFPPGVLLIWLSGAGLLYRSLSLTDLQTGRLTDPAAASDQLVTQLAASMAYLFVYAFFWLAWSAAIVATTDAYLRGEEPVLRRVYGRTLRSYFWLLLSSLLFLLALGVLLLLAVAAFVATGFGVVGSLIAIVCLLVWWLRRGMRKTWLKVLIVVTTPFGMPLYFGFRWTMYVAAGVLEKRGPLDALRRSGQITERHWFRVFAILLIAGVIVSVMLNVLDSMVALPLTIFEATRGQLGLNPMEAAFSSGFSFVVRILLSSIGTIVYTLLFIDLRNRREGTDIAERVSQLEAEPIPTHG